MGPSTVAHNAALASGEAVTRLLLRQVYNKAAKDMHFIARVPDAKT